VVYAPHLLDRLQAIAPTAWAGRAFRHMFADYAPEVENTRGARWNPPGVAAIYMSLSREGVLAEAEHQLAVQPIRPRVRHTLYTLDLTLQSVLELTDADILRDLGVGTDELSADDMRTCQDVGGAIAWLDHDGILVPSARSPAINLVIFPTNRTTGVRFEVIGREEIRNG
jgi:RES domain-containing protein